MVLKMGNTVTDASSEEDTIPDSSKLNGQESNGQRVYRRRIRSLKDLPVQVIRHPNYIEGRGVDCLSNTITSGGIKAGRHDPVVDGDKPRSRLKAKRLPIDGGSRRGPSRSKSSLIEVTPELGQVRGRLNVQYCGTAAELGKERRIRRIVTVTPSSEMPSRAAASEVLPQLGRNGKMKKHAKQSGPQRQSTIDQFFKDPKRKVEVVRPKQDAASEVEIYVLGAPKRNGKGPSRYKRKTIVGVDNLVAPPKGNVFPPVPLDEEFLPLKRQKIRNKEVRDRSLFGESAGIGLSSKKRAPVIESDTHEGQLSETTRKKMRKVPTVPLKEASIGLVSVPVEALGSLHSDLVPVSVPMEALASVNSNPVPMSIPVEALGSTISNLGPASVQVETFESTISNLGSVSVPVEALGSTNSNLVPVSVPVETLRSPTSNLNPASVPVEALGIPNSSLVPMDIPVEALKIPHTNLGSVSISVESLGIPQSNQDRIPVEAVGCPRSNVVPVPDERILDSKVQVKRRISKVTARKKLSGIKNDPRKKLSGIKKDGTPDGRFKTTREGLGFTRKWKENAGKEPLQTLGKQALNGIAGEVHAKKLPEVQKNGVRKPKRVQLKRLFVEVHLPGVDSVTNSRVVKSLWSPPKQMEHKGEAGSLEPVAPHRPVKSTKFLSLQQLDASGKLDKPRPTCSETKESEDSASDQTVSDCLPQGKKQIGTTSEHSAPQEMQDVQQNMSVPLKARSGKEEEDVNQKVASYQLNTTRLTGDRNCSNLGGALASSVNTKTRKQRAKVPLTRTNGNLDRGSGVFEMTLRRRERLSTSKPNVEMTNRDLQGASGASETTLETRKQLTTAHKIEEMASGILEATCGDLELSPRTSTKSPSAEQMPGGDFEGAKGVPRMTPRTRKLTDAMQNFLHQKATLLRQWKEMELGKLHPMALIGRSCKIFWPLDNEWYPGVIHEYNPQTRRHRIDYEDDEREWVLLGKERVKLHVSAEESKTLEMSFGEGSLLDHRKKLDADELAILAAGLEGSHGDLSHGDLVWAKVKGYPMWPACVMDEEHASACGLELSPRERTVPVQFFGSYDHARCCQFLQLLQGFCRTFQPPLPKPVQSSEVRKEVRSYTAVSWINSKKVVPFPKGIVHKYHTKCKRTVFEQGLQEIERYLKECKLPDQMAQLQEDAVAVTKKADDLTSNEVTDEEDQDFVNDESNTVVKNALETPCTFPLELGSLRVLALGKIVRDSEQFHTENHIWTEGYIAIRKFSSMKDPEKIVEYKMEVVRNPSIPSLPLFRVTPEDDKLVEASTASGCWKRILIKIQRAKEKAGLCIATLLEKKRQSFRSGPSMFGFGNRRVSKLIQALPNARVCSKFTAWIEKPLLTEGAEELAPAGYRPVEVCWKHLDRCNICYVDEEYADNQLLQCDKCRTMVHMYCYGELEPPDGDLWLCNLCRPEAPKRSPFCCLCPVTGGAMKTTTDGRWAHLTCAMWTPETCLVDVKRMEPVDGISSISKERWKLVCIVCKVPYGACIQCSKPHCRVAFHPLCARGAGLCMEVLEDKATSITDSDGGLQLLTYCKKHSLPMAHGGVIRPQSQQTVAVSQNRPAVSPPLAPLPPCNPSGCARSEPYNAASRRGHRQPEALAAALAKRFFVENKPYFVTGCQRNVPDRELKSLGGSLWSWHWKQSKSSFPANGEGTSNDDEGDSEKTLQSTSERYRHMRSTMHERLTFGKSSIHGWGVFTKRSHSMGDMVIEYSGEIVRPIIADIRERRSYDSLVGAGTYMFRIDDERVVDATHAGSIAHLINHSCEPNCYSRVVAASGEDHIIIFAKRDIREGEELTYDYRFASKDELLTCYCGCAGCRGFVNTFDSEEEPTRIIASRSELTKWVVP